MDQGSSSSRGSAFAPVASAIRQTLSRISKPYPPPGKAFSDRSLMEGWANTHGGHPRLAGRGPGPPRCWDRQEGSGDR